MQDVFQELYNVILDRRENPQEGSYTCYLFEKGTDKILKKVAEESGETIIAAKNGVKEDTVAEIGDLLFHLLVLMANEGIDVSDGDGRACSPPSEIRQPQAVSSGG